MLVCVAVILSNNAMAESAKFKSAVKIFKQGYAECTEAQRIRSQDINQASEKFKKYLELKDKAAKIDSTILKTNLHNIAREIEFCQGAEQDILRTKAFPIMEAALESCKKSKTQIAKSDFVNATSSYKKYEELYLKATTITSSIEKVSSIKIKVGRCNKLKKKITAAEVQLTKVKSAFEADHKTITNALNSCNQAQKLLANKKPSKASILKAKGMLNNSKSAFTKLINKRNQSSSQKKFSALRINQQITNKISSTNKCHSALSSSITTNELARKKKDTARKQLAKEKIEKEKLAAEKQKTALLEKKEVERLAKEAKVTELRKQAEAKRIAKLKASDEQRMKEEEQLKRDNKIAAEKNRKMNKERLKKKRKSQNWSSSLGEDDNSSSKEIEESTKDDTDKTSKRKSSDWRGLTN